MQSHDSWTVDRNVIAVKRWQRFRYETFIQNRIGLTLGSVSLQTLLTHANWYWIPIQSHLGWLIWYCSRYAAQFYAVYRIRLSLAEYGTGSLLIEKERNLSLATYFMEATCPISVMLAILTQTRTNTTETSCQRRSLSRRQIMYIKQPTAPMFFMSRIGLYFCDRLFGPSHLVRNVASIRLIEHYHYVRTRDNVKVL